jgi:uncharacterized membrane protein YqaE (UPF0057 family)
MERLALRAAETSAMLFLLAFLLPPLAVLLTGRPIQALISIVLTLLGWVPGVVHALLVVNNYYADRRAERIIQAMREANRR